MYVQHFWVRLHNWGHKTAYFGRFLDKIRQLCDLVADNFGTKQDIDNPKKLGPQTDEIRPAF